MAVCEILVLPWRGEPISLLTSISGPRRGRVRSRRRRHPYRGRARRRLEAAFDSFLQQRTGRTGESLRPFDSESDYRRYVDGKPRHDGVRSFLASRGIDLPDGTSDDPPNAETVCGLGNRKNQLFRERLANHGVEVFETPVALIRRLRAVGLKTGVVTSSKNAAEVLGRAGLADLFDVRSTALRQSAWG